MNSQDTLNRLPTMNFTQTVNVVVTPAINADEEESKENDNEAT